MKDFFLQPGTRRAFVTTLVICGYILLVLKSAPDPHISFMGGAMMLALGYWFGQHSNKPPSQ